MPIKPENRHRYPANWREIRERILERAKHRCEFCGVPNYALGYRDESGYFHSARGNEWHDRAGRGCLPHKEAREGADEINAHYGGLGPKGERAVVIVLTIAHLDQTPENNDESNLRALCQRCHLRHDRQQHAENAKATRRKKLDRARPMLATMEA